MALVPLTHEVQVSAHPTRTPALYASLTIPLTSQIWIASLVGSISILYSDSEPTLTPANQSVPHVCMAYSKAAFSALNFASSTAHTPAQIFAPTAWAAGTAIFRVSQSLVEYSLKVLYLTVLVDQPWTVWKSLVQSAVVLQDPSGFVAPMLKPFSKLATGVAETTAAAAAKRRVLSEYFMFVVVCFRGIRM
jgi:hypothetical protein